MRLQYIKTITIQQFRDMTPASTAAREQPRPQGLSLTHKSSQDFSGTGSASTTEILGIYSFNTSLEQV
jgi:hypothetical protein